MHVIHINIDARTWILMLIRRCASWLNLAGYSLAAMAWHGACWFRLGLSTSIALWTDGLYVRGIEHIDTYTRDGFDIDCHCDFDGRRVWVSVRANRW